MLEVIIEKLDDTLEVRRGYLLKAPARGEAIVFLQDDWQRVVTSRVIKLEDLGANELRVATRNSSYRISILRRKADMSGLLDSSMTLSDRDTRRLEKSVA